MKTKKMLSWLLVLVLCIGVLPMSASAAETLEIVEIPKPITPNYFIHNTKDDGTYDSITMFAVMDEAMTELYVEWDKDEDAFNSKYGVRSFDVVAQFDVNINGTGWLHTAEWDEYNGFTASTSRSVQNKKVEEFYLADLVYSKTAALYEERGLAVPHRSGKEGGWQFDTQNGTMQIRWRYFMQWRADEENVVRVGEWSDPAVFGKGSTQRIVSEPTGYEAPVISAMEVVPPTATETNAHVYFELDTPDSVWDAEMYYAMNDIAFGIDGLEAEISVNGSDWQSLRMTNAGTLREGRRETSSTAVLTQESYVQLRVRYVGDAGYSPWSNVLSVNAPNWEASEWATEELQQADKLGLIPDILQGADLTQSITRAEFAAVSVKAYEALSNGAAIPAVNNPFTDTTDIEVLKAYNTGITSGVSATEFAPNDLLNREQAATMLTRVFKKVSLAGWTLAEDSKFTLPYEKPAAFADDKDISDWAKDSVYFMAANGIIAGVGNNKFAPKNVTTEDEATGYANATREQALVIAVRMIENLKK